MQVEYNAMLMTPNRHKWTAVLLVGFLISIAGAAFAQPVISYITPDAGAPGMCVAVEIIAPANAGLTFGIDTMYTDGSLVKLTRPGDSALVRLGPSIVSWNGRLIQQMFLIKSNIKSLDTEVYFNVYHSGVSAVDSFEIVQPYDVGKLSGGGPITGKRSKRNTMVVDSLILENGTFTIPSTDPDPSTPGNQAYLPFRILSMGPIRLVGASITADGSSGATGSKGGDGGPGGGGGGSGYPGYGGAGYTGGGGDNDGSSGPGGTGSGFVSATPTGGQSLNGVAGGDGEQHSSSGGDDGGGGGTGLPFGKSGTHGTNTPSPAGGYGGGSAGGSTSSYTANYGGGGGGFLTNGNGGQGSSTSNGGNLNGNAMLVPLTGGSGGGAGNQTYISFFGGSQGGCGGGGGGAVELTSFSSFEMLGNGLIADGGAGDNAKPQTFEPAAGGGGGAGGAYEISARDSILMENNAYIMVDGGQGGFSSNSNSNGGNGSWGRIRINGYVSKYASSNSNPYFLDTNGYAGPSIQRVTSTADSVTVHGYGEVWDGVSFEDTTRPILVYHSWPSSGIWQADSAVPKADPKSHTYQWNVTFPNSANLMDSLVYAVAVLDQTPYHPNVYTDDPPDVMSHTSGIISKVTGPPKMSLKDTAINFGSVLVDSCTHDTTIEIYSVGRGQLIVDSVVLVPPLSDFKIKTSFPDTIPYGDSLAFVVSFCPTLEKCPIVAKLDLYSNAPPIPTASISLTGCGIQPHAMLNPIVIDFGRVHIGDCKDTFAEVIDTGSSELTISRESFGDPSHFMILDPLPIIIPAHDSAQVHLAFCPSDTAADTTIDTIQSNAPESPNLLTLLGSGRIGVLSLPASLDFGLVHLDSCKDSGFYAKNNGNDSLLVTRQMLVGSGGFTVLSPPTPFEIPADSSVFVTLQYCAMDTGVASGALTQVTDVPDSGIVLLFAHSGIGILSIVSTIDFGNVPTGSCIDTSVRVTNIGTDTLFLDSPKSITPPFYYLGPSPIVLAPGASDSVRFRFCSIDTNAHQETAAFDTVRPGVSPSFTLLGRGIQGALSTSGAIDIGCIAIGSGTTKTVAIRNTGTAPLDSLVASVLPSGVATIGHQPANPLAPGKADSVVLIVPASTYGPIAATLSINWIGGSATLPITGEVTSAPALMSLDSTVIFDTTVLGDTSITKCIRLTNYSCIPLAVDSAIIIGGLPGEFQIVSNTASPALSDSSTGSICIHYIPRRVGTDTSELVIESGTNTIPVAILTGVGKGTAVGVDLAVDTIAGRAGQVVNVPVRTLNDITAAAITTVTFRVTFNPMQLDLRQPVAPPTFSIIPAATTASYSVHNYSIGDKEITATYSASLTGKPIVAELPFEILEPTANTAAIHLASASFGTSPASLATSGDGEIVIEQCDTNDQVALSTAPIAVAPNTPNPFSSHTAIAVSVRIAGHLTMELYNALGLKVLVPFDADVAPGQTIIPIDASSLPSGAYRYVTTWRATESGAYQAATARDEKTMIVLGE